MRCKIFTIVVLSGVAFLPAAQACFKGIDPGGFADGCPVIVSGTIFQIEEPAEQTDQADAIAWIQIAKVDKNLLNDEPLIKDGGVVKVRMVGRNRRTRLSTDISYPVGTPGVWLIAVGKNGDLRIDQHPVQRQPQPKAGEKIALGLEVSDVVEKRAGQEGQARTGFTKEQWLQKRGEKDRKQVNK